MSRIILSVELLTREGTLTGRRAEKAVDLPAVPQRGDQVVVREEGTGMTSAVVSLTWYLAGPVVARVHLAPESGERLADKFLANEGWTLDPA